MFWSFRVLVLHLYEDWYEYLQDSLSQEGHKYFESIHLNKAAEEEWPHSLNRLCHFLAQKTHWKVMVFIDEYEAPYNRAYEHDFFKTVASFISFPITVKADSDPG